MESAVDLEDFLRKVKKLELEELAKFKFTPACLIDLDGLLCDTFVKQNPRPVDYQNRQDLVRIFNVMAQEAFGTSNSCVEGYGSFIMDMFNEKSDLDLSINLTNTEVEHQKKIKMLKIFHKKLLSIKRKGHISDVQLVSTARVPIIKLTDRGSGIECDLSIDNRDGIAKSHIIHAISGIDERFRKLCFLMKSWAKANNINSARDRSLNSFSIVSLVAFHLQTCNPPILPPFSDLLGEGDNPAASVATAVKNYINYGKRNKESLAVLFMNLFIKLASVEKLWQNGACVSLSKGSWILKSWGSSRAYSISIEDFTKLSENAARAVGAEGFKKIYSCIHKSLKWLLMFLNGQMPGTELMRLLFKADTVSTIGIGVASNTNKNNALTWQDSLRSRKRRLEEGLAQNQVKIQRRHGTEHQRMVGMHQAARQTVPNSVPSSYAPPVSYQPPLALPRTNINGNAGYAPGAGPSHLEGFHNLSQAQLFHSQSLQGQSAVTLVGNIAFHSHPLPASHNPYRGDQTSHQNAVAPIQNRAIHSHPPPHQNAVTPIRNGAIHSFPPHHQNAFAPVGNGAIYSHPPHQNAVAPIWNGAIHSHSHPPHQNAVAPIWNGAIHSHPPPHQNVVAPIGNGAIRPPQQYATAPIGNGAIYAHPPLASHNPYRGDHNLYNHRRY